MNAYGYRENLKTKRSASAISTAIRFLRAVFEVLCERITARAVRIAAVMASFIISLGLVGGMESGSVPIYIGFPICLIFAIAVMFIHFDD